MTSWAQFADEAPQLAGFGVKRLQGRLAYLSTLRRDGSPRVHPVSPVVAHGGLYVYMEPTSPKCHDLRRDARYGLHCAVEDNSGGGGEFLVSGRAGAVTDERKRAEVFEAARSIGYNPQDRYVLFELSVEAAKSTTYEDDAPRRATWKAG